MRTLVLFFCLMLSYASALVGFTWLLTEYVKDDSCVGSLCASSVNPIQAEWPAWKRPVVDDDSDDDLESDDEALH